MTTISLTTPRRLLLIAAAMLLALAIAAAAPAVSRAAQTFCVHQAGFTCPAGSVDEGKNLQPALDDASKTPSTPSAPNVITIGPGTYEPPSGQGFTATTSSPLQIIGAGIGQTTLSDPGGQSSPLTEAVSLAGPAASSTSISDLTVSSSDEETLVTSRVTVEHVAVDPIGSGNGILFGNGTVKDSTIDLPARSMAAGIVELGPSTSEIDDVTVDGGGAGILGGPANIHRARLIGSSIPLIAQGAPVYIDDSLLVGENGIRAQNDGAGNQGSITALNDTIVAAGSSPQVGVKSWSSQSPAQADVQISNSIVRGFPTSFETTAVPGGSATLEAFNDNFDGTTQGTSISVAGQVPGAPGFINPSADDYRLAWNSPLIDAGDTGFVSNLASATDLDGNPREVPAIRSSSPLDLGAYEYQHRAPNAVASAAPGSASPGSAFTFDGSRSTDPDDGDTLTYAWSFDDGATGIGATVTHVFNTPGTHTGTLTVTDPTGLASKQQATVTVTSPPAPPTTTPPTTTPSTTKSTGTNTNPATPHLTVLGKPSVRGNKVTLQLSCIGSTACTGTRVTETTNKTSQVASVRLSLKPGQTKTITLTVNGKGKGLLAHLGKLPVVITVTLNTATVKTAHATLHAPKKPRHRHP